MDGEVHEVANSPGAHGKGSQPGDGAGCGRMVSTLAWTTCREDMAGRMPLVVSHAVGRRAAVSHAVEAWDGNDRRSGALAAGGSTGRRRGYGGKAEDTHCDDVQRDRGAGGDRSMNPHDSSVGQSRRLTFRDMRTVAYSV